MKKQDWFYSLIGGISILWMEKISLMETKYYFHLFTIIEIRDMIFYYNTNMFTLSIFIFHFNFICVELYYKFAAGG